MSEFPDLLSTAKKATTYLGRTTQEVWNLVADYKRCPFCFSKDYSFLRYNESHPAHTDDTWHVFACHECKSRVGRWSGAFLRNGRVEDKGRRPCAVSAFSVGNSTEKGVLLDGFNKTIGSNLPHNEKD